MDSISTDKLAVDLKDLAGDYPPFLKVNEDGTVQRYQGTEIVKASYDVKTNVVSKDVTISSDSSIAARLFLPKPITNQNENQKLPTLVYFHGGAFCIQSPYSPPYHNHLNLLVSKANVVAVSVQYRKAPEFSLPIALEDSWLALKWVASHFDSNGPDEWLNRYADLKQLFLVGDSAGANISHHMAIKIGMEDILQGVKLQGVVLVHPYFWGDPVPKVVPPGMADPDRMWHILCPTSIGSDDPMVNPSKDMNMKILGCRRVLVFVAGLDGLFRKWGLYYKQLLEKIGWDGIAELIEHKNQPHVFHLDYPTCDDAISLVNSIVAFINMKT